MSDNSTIVARTSRTAFAAEREARGKSAALVVITGELAGTIFDLDRDEISVGRSDEADIPLEFAGISRRHLLLKAVGDSFAARDIGSKNGTFVNDSRIAHPVVLNKGDVLRLGPIVFKYLPKGDPERLAYDKLNYRGNVDRFTGCYNKSYFNEHIGLEVRKCKATATALSLVIFDLDHFKSINDDHGHPAGDFVLRELAGLVRANGVRKHDVLARYGGEEFVILLPETGRETAIEIAERLRQRVAEHGFDYEGHRLPVTVSVGVAVCDKGVATGAELFRRADSALYAAKQAGRNQVRTYRG